MKKISILIPCYNEEKTLELAYRDLPRHIDGIDTIEYLIINDGSKDGTVQKARELGFHHVVSFRRNKGLARGFLAGLDACLRLGADIIVNTDADNQYCGADIETLVRPILDKKAHIVIGERPIDDTEHFTPLKKKLQHFGSWVVRKASKTTIPDAPSGFRAYSREAAMRINVINDYTYTLETIVQSGREKMAVMSVPIRTNPELRESRLFHSMWGYIKKSMLTIVRTYLMYRPLYFFFMLGSILALVGVGFFVRYFVFFCSGEGGGHLQSLILASTLLIVGFQTIVVGLLGDVISANRKILQDVQYHVRKMDYSRQECEDEKSSDLVKNESGLSE